MVRGPAINTCPLVISKKRATSATNSGRRSPSHGSWPSSPSWPLWPMAKIARTSGMASPVRFASSSEAPSRRSWPIRAASIRGARSCRVTSALEKRQYQRKQRARLLVLRHMVAALEQRKPGMGQCAAEAPSDGGRHDRILAAPDQERRLPDRPIAGLERGIGLGHDLARGEKKRVLGGKLVIGSGVAFDILVRNLAPATRFGEKNAGQGLGRHRGHDGLR